MATLLLGEVGDKVGDVEPPVEPPVGYIKEPVGLAVAETVTGRIVPVYAAVYSVNYSSCNG
jgi:hypothetical protein